MRCAHSLAPSNNPTSFVPSTALAKLTVPRLSVGREGACGCKLQLPLQAVIRPHLRPIPSLVNQHNGNGA